MTQLLPGITTRSIETPRLRTAVLSAGDDNGEVVLFVHGNVSSSLFWQHSMKSLPAGYRALAPDLRGFGDSQTAPVDATRGLGDFADDVLALMDALEISKAHLVGWSMGGGIVSRILLDHPERVASLTLVAPVSPYGFGGTKGLDGTPVAQDDPGTGGGTANPEFVAALSSGDDSDSPNTARNVMNGFYFADGFKADLEQTYVESMLSTVVGDDNYPGDFVASENWPGMAAGTRGVLNTMAPQYHNVSGIVDLENKPPVLWIHGAKDAIVSDESGFDLATLGKLGVVPGWPGADVAPPQPMVSQTRAVLEAYGAAGGKFTEVVLDCGHSPQVERPEEFAAAISKHLSES
ncbi:MAG: alpha/beta hydrolase [Aeromicrobium sp.]|nr:MAG: alpha/beta hydrolase [Aeromicrobium sp.]